MDYKHLDFEYIVNWCTENNEIKWLKDTVNSKVKDKKTGEERDISFIELKMLYCEKFAKDLLPAKKVKKPSMKDIVNAL